MTSTTSLARPAYIIPATVGTIAVAVALPFLVHMFPPVGGAPLGAVLLPLFIAPFIAAAVFHPAVALIASLVTPSLNRLITGMPLPPMALLLTIELTVFSVAALALTRLMPRSFLNAPLAYLVAKLVAAGLGAFGLLKAVGPGYLTGALVNAIPGLIILALINFVVIRYFARSGR